MAGPNWSTIWRQSLRSCLIALRAICRCDFAQLKLLLAYLFVLFGYLYCLLTCDNSLMLFAKLTNSSDIAMKYAEKHIENAPALTKVVFFAEQSDFVDKSGRWVESGISRGGCRLRRLL